ncbi:NYN domain-containing protein [Candidatus Pacearchaeota archaeon]|nr:NYN domain-containing protein [Candidatus Pacearchaeota archaeon]MBD3282812.1 NYN domain-containing protein [Candidatus Pacearchaeota archaeon]
MAKERVAIFIDGSNLYNNLKRYKIKTIFENLIRNLENRREIVDIYYYTALLDKEYDSEAYEKHNKFLEKIKLIPNLHVTLCNLRKITLKDGSVEFFIKGDDVNLATDLIKGSFKDLYDVAIIVSGDEDFLPAIKVVQENNKKVINAFFPKSSSYLLRNCCDSSINLKKALLQKKKS